MPTTGRAPLSRRQALVCLNLIQVLLPQHLVKLLGIYGSPEKILGASPTSLVKEGGLEEGFVQTLVKQREAVFDLAEKEGKEAEKRGIRLLTPEDEEYPELLKAIYDPPQVLYVLGQPALLQGKGVAMVGSRKASAYGKLMAERLAGGMAQHGVTVVSGLARGVDTSVHQAALAHQGRTVGVLGCGLSQCYPPENGRLMDRMAKEGAVVSEFPLHAKPYPHHFPRRNRIISGLCEGTVVIEAAKDSGALITADFALEQGRDVFAVPGPVGAPGSEGTHRLLKQGAGLVESAEDLLAAKPSWAAVSRAAGGRIPPSSAVSEDAVSLEARAVYQQLSGEPEHIDVLTRRSGLSVHQLSASLVELELSGLVKQFSGKLFAKI